MTNLQHQVSLDRGIEVFLKQVDLPKHFKSPATGARHGRCTLRTARFATALQSFMMAWNHDLQTMQALTPAENRLSILDFCSSGSCGSQDPRARSLVGATVYKWCIRPPDPEEPESRQERKLLPREIARS